MKIAPTSPRIWHVAFVGTKRDHPYDWMSPLGFLHVFAFGFIASADRWVVYDVGLYGTEILCFPNADQFSAWYARLLEEGATVVKVVSKPCKPLTGRMGLTCVNAVKRLVGARSSALRPIGLFRDLVAQGGKVVFLRGQLQDDEQ